MTGNVAASLNANTVASANHAGPSVCLPINAMVATRWNADDGRTTLCGGEPGDPQFTLGAAHEHGVCYALKGNYIDRETRQNGTGWREGESYTLDATDRHGVVYPQVARSLCARMDSSPCVDRGQEVVCYGLSRSFVKGGSGSTGGIPVEHNLQPTMTGNGCGGVAYDARGNGGGGASER